MSDGTSENLGILIDAIEAERTKLIMLKAVVVGSPTELTIRRCDPDSIAVLGQAWFRYGRKQKE